MSETNFKHTVEDHDEIWSRRVCPSCHKFDPKSVEVTDYSGPEMANFEYMCVGCSVVWTWAEGAPVGNGPDRPPHIDECGICGDWDCFGDCEKRDQESLDRAAYTERYRDQEIDEVQEIAEHLDIDPEDVEFAKAEAGTCNHCGMAIEIDRDQIWVDETGGDACCGDVFTELNTDGQHEPKARAEVVGDDISDWVWKDGIKYPGGDGTVWVSEYAPMRVWELQAALARLNPTDHVLIAAPCDSRSEWLNIGMVVAPNGPDPQNVSAVTLFPGLEWNSFDMAIDWDSRADRGLFR
jgi:hypothetical protein